ncbi:MAG TPA: rRNA maturation RNase YbeY, partial [Dehalococcoidia bacterium]|nr:rRNA maturation RNase YbeY [Dehalococcoidia bacterium]
NVFYRLLKENQEERQKLIIHGILHLNGYDHENIKDEKKMTEKQNYILNKI